MSHATHSRRHGWRAIRLLLPPLAFVAACENVNPIDVENPRTTDDDLAEALEPTTALLPGLRAAFATALGAVVIVTENVSDNYSIHGTGLVKELDEPRLVTPSLAHIDATDGTGIHFTLQELRALADFVLDDIVPQDETATAAQIAEAHFYRGMAFLIQAENFSAVPVERDGSPVPASQLVGYAIADLDAARQGEGGIVLAATGALARAHRLAGDADRATAAANQLLTANPEFVFEQGYDAQTIDNAPHAYLYTRALQEMQPLPRLDFLDPKYTTRSAAIPVVKAEEMHLIIAEAAMVGGDWSAGRDALADAIRLALSRPRTTGFQDDDPRGNADLTIRPRDAVIRIRADADSPYRTGLVLDRPGAIDAPTISWSSLDPDSIANIAPTDGEALLHALHLARQEILFLEGRRMSDLGIRLPIMLREIDANPSIDPGAAGTSVFVPAYIPPRDEMDLFTPQTTYQGTLLDSADDVTLVETEVTIMHDMNRILAVNRVSPFGSF